MSNEHDMILSVGNIFVNLISEYTVGQHEDAVRCLEFSEEKNIIASGSWDRLVKLWDARSLGPIGIHSQQDQVLLPNYKQLIGGKKLCITRNILICNYWIFNCTRFTL